MELYASLREQGVLVSTGRLHPVDVATTIRQRGSEPEIVDGPFAVTKEILAGYYVLECADLDEALRHARRSAADPVRVGGGAAGHGRSRWQRRMPGGERLGR